MKKVLGVILVFIMFLFISDVSAKTLSELKSELSAAEAKLNKAQTDKVETEEDIKGTRAKIDEINGEKQSVSNEIDALNEEIQKLGVEIDKMKEEIKNIVHYYQMSSTNSIYLEYVFNANDFTDFIYRLAVAEQLSEYREETIDKYNKLMDENRNKLNELAKKQVTLASLEEQLQTELSKLNENLEEISEISVDAEKEIKELKSTISTYQNKYGCSLNEDVSTCINRYNKKKAEEAAAEEARRRAQSQSSSGGSSVIVSSGGFYRPVTSGRVNANYGYTAYYGSVHDGMDLGVPHGTPVYPIANGYVARVSLRNSCGGNEVFIVYNVNGRTYTSLYAHLASVAVSEGQYVTVNQVVAYSGGVPSIETWDGCSTGAHLHFQMATGAYMSDYISWSAFSSRKFDPRQLVNFPAMFSSFSGR